MIPAIENGCGGTGQILFVRLFLCFPSWLSPPVKDGEITRGTRTEKATVIETHRQDVILHNVPFLQSELVSVGLQSLWLNNGGPTLGPLMAF